MNNLKVVTQSPAPVRQWIIHPVTLDLLRYARYGWDCINVTAKAHWQHRMTLDMLQAASQRYLIQIEANGAVDEDRLDATYNSTPRVDKAGSNKSENDCYVINPNARNCLDNAFELGGLLQEPIVPLLLSDHQAAFVMLCRGMRLYRDQIQDEEQSSRATTDLSSAQQPVHELQYNLPAATSSSKAAEMDQQHNNDQDPAADGRLVNQVLRDSSPLKAHSGERSDGDDGDAEDDALSDLLSYDEEDALSYLLAYDEDDELSDLFSY